jgi:hypothetical protein
MSLCREKVVDFIASQALSAPAHPAQYAENSVAQRITASVTSTSDFAIGGKLYFSRTAIPSIGDDSFPGLFLPLTIVREDGVTVKYLTPLTLPVL